MNDVRSEETKIDAAEPVPVVAIGASAGGLDALKEFLGSVSEDPGACFVVIQHLDPSHKSMLTELLSRMTRLPVEVVTHGVSVRKNHVYVIPEDTTLTLEDGKLILEHPAPPRSLRTPIDTFFTSLAKSLGERAVAIVLSGTGSDGTQGIKLLKEAGGYSIVQEPGDATYDSMPRNAIATGLIDLVLAPRDMPEAILDYLRCLREGVTGTELDAKASRKQLARICQQLKLATGHDFRQYKEPTLLRRVRRRMQVLRLDSLEAYAEALRDDKVEARQLFRELLISVTAFFRDPGAFEALEASVDKMLATKPLDEAVRVWVAGCATGEEAYSLAMLLHEKAAGHEQPRRIQVFATDIDEAALAVARQGCYPESIAAYVPDPYLKRYFKQVGSEYQLAEEIRELCIFSTQSLIKDPPFSRLDLLSCRNVLIYLKSELQNRLIPIFHYALRPGGILLLGPSESVTGHEQLFEFVDKKWRLLRRRAESSGAQPRFPLMHLDATMPSRRPKAGAGAQRERNSVVAAAQQILLDELGPAYTVVGPNRELIYSGGRIRNFLEMQPGAPSLELINLAPQGLRLDLRALWHRMTTEQEEVVRDCVVPEDDAHKLVRLTGRPLGEDDAGEAHYLVAFQDLGLQMLPDSITVETGDDVQLLALEAELRSTREYLQTTTEELESSNEELKSANEELMSMNEELQSSNEELETSKEELQSVNEELETVNGELTHKVEQLGEVNTDLANLLSSTDIATLFLDRDARVRRFTPVARKLFHLIEADVGRSIADISARIADVDLAKDAAKVFDSLAPIEREVSLRDGGGVFIMRMLPYRSPNDMIDGVVVTFVDVSQLKASQDRIDDLNRQLRGQIDDLSTLLDLAPIGVAFADDPDCSKIDLNDFGRRITRLPKQTEPAGRGPLGYEVYQDGKLVPPHDLPMQRVWKTGETVQNFRGCFERPDGTQFEMLMSAAPVRDAEGKLRRVIGIFNDISPLVKAEEEAETRAAQHEYVAFLGKRSLEDVSAEAMIAEIPERLADLLDVDCAKVLLCEPGQNDLLLAAQYGFDSPVGIRVGTGSESQAGYTLGVREPVVVEDLAKETRFSGPALLRDAGIVSGLSVIIGNPEEPFGVLGAHTKTPRSFNDDDRLMMQSVANVLAATLRRTAADNQKQLLLDELRHRVKNMLATVQSVTSMTLRGATLDPQVKIRLMDRIQALALAHDLNFRRQDTHVDLTELVRLQIRPYDTDGSRITVKGQGTVDLPPEVAINISLVVHELVTNAVKHGALSGAEGDVHISIRDKQPNGDRAIELRWVEQHKVVWDDEVKEGSGGKLIRAIAAQPHFDIAREAEPGGLIYVIKVQL